MMRPIHEYVDLQQAKAQFGLKIGALRLHKKLCKQGEIVPDKAKAKIFGNAYLPSKDKSHFRVTL